MSLALRSLHPHDGTRRPPLPGIPWPATETRFVTGTRVTPDKQSIVLHVIIFVVGPDQVEEFQAYDDAEEGPGYTCYGGPVPVSDDTAAGILTVP